MSIESPVGQSGQRIDNEMVSQHEEATWFAFYMPPNTMHGLLARNRTMIGDC